MNTILITSAGVNIEVASSDFKDKMNWDDAKNACDSLGDGWRLPTVDEFELIFSELFQKGNGNFQMSYYWTCDEIEDDTAWDFYFVAGKAYGYFKSSTYFVRAVRNI
jgi:hypothetical protein